MKISFSDYIKKTDATVLAAEAIFSVLEKDYDLQPIGKVVKTTSGGTPSRSNPTFYNGEIPWLKSGELNDNFIELTEEHITKAGLDGSSAKIFPKETLLVAMYGATVGKTGILKIDAATNQAICACFPKDELDRDYLFWFLRQYRYRFIEQSKGGAQPNISQTVIKKTALPLPPKDVQKKLAAFLFKCEKEGLRNINQLPTKFRDAVSKVFNTKNSIVELQSEINNQQNLLTQLRQSILQEAIQGKLVLQDPTDEPAAQLLERIQAGKARLIAEKKIRNEKPLPPINEEEIPFALPEGWVWCRLGEVGLFQRGKSKHRPRNDEKLFIDGKHPFVQTGDVANSYKTGYKINTCSGFYNEVGLNQSKLWQKGTLCITIAANIAETGFLDFDACVPDSVVTFTPLIGSELNKYIQFFIEVSKANIQAFAPATAQKNINLGIIYRLLFPLPPLAEQRRIVAKVEQLLEQVAALEAQVQQSQQEAEVLMQAVLQEAFEVGAQ